MRVVALTSLLAACSACAPGRNNARSEKDAASTTEERWEVRSVPIPDLSRLPESVQAQVRERYAALAEKTAAPGTAPQELARAHGDVGLILMAAGYHAAAETSLRNAQALAPGDPTWPYYLGQLFLLTTDRANTLKSFERALALRPKDLPTLVRLGEAYLDQNRPDEAERLFLRARDIEPRSAAVLDGLGRVAQARGQHARAAEFLEQALTLDPQATGLHYPLAVAYRSLGDQSKAEAHLRLRGEGRPSVYDPLMQAYYWLLDSADAHYNRGVLAMKAGKWQAAAELFRKGLALEPESAQLRHGLGLALYWMKDGDGAAREFEQVLRRSPDHVETHVSLGILYAERSRFRDALVHFEAASKYDASRVDAQVGQAEMLRNLGDLPASLLHWRRVRELDPNDARAWIEGAKVLMILGRYGEARAWLAEARLALPDRPDLKAMEQDVESAAASRRAVRK
jgi:tetratricopeptide (TPR) repeat protein